MKFEDLYSRVFISEAAKDQEPEAENTEESDSEDITDATDEVPMPDDYDVEGMPVPPARKAPALPSTDGTPSASTEAAPQTIMDFITKLDDFAETLNGLGGVSLQKLVSDLDTVGTVYQGLSQATSKDIVNVAKTLTDLSQTLKGFIVTSAKREKDMAAQQQTVGTYRG